MASEGKPVIAARLAETLGVTPPTVTATIQRLSKDGLVEAGGRREIRLTERGLRQAEFMVRRHHLAERFLADVLQIPWHQVHEEAHRLEHGISPEVERRLAAWLGQPRTCPHGNPIPGQGQRTDLVPLNSLPEGSDAVVERILEHAEDDSSFLEFLDRHRLRPGAQVRVLRSEPFNQTVRIVVDGNEVALGTHAAINLWVRRAG
jgi:DtxR family Mn-dependent transcriptional regulator